MKFNMKFNIFKKRLILATCLIMIFFLSILVWYSPIIFKGNSSIVNGSDAFVLARNYALTGRYASDNNLNVILSSDLIQSQAVTSGSGNKLGIQFYSILIKIFNPLTNEHVVLINCFVLALALVILSWTTYYLFGFKTFIFSSLIYIFIPTIWFLPHSLVGYELAILFLSIFILFLSLNTKKFTTDISDIKLIKFWPHGLGLILAGFFLTLACLSRESFFLLFLILFIYLLRYKLKKYLFYIFIPAGILLCLIWLPTFLNGQNIYLNLFLPQTDGKTQAADLNYYSHFFPDPYTFHFEQQSYLQSRLSTVESRDLMTQIGLQKITTNIGFNSLNLWQRLKIGTSLLFRQLFRFFSITEIGGVLMFLLFILGLINLKKQHTQWYNFFKYWLLGTIFILAYIILANRNHLMDFGWLIAVCVAGGIILLGNLLQTKFDKHKTLIQTLLLLLVIYNLILCSHVMWGQHYDKQTISNLTLYSQAIKHAKLNSTDIVAVPFDSLETYDINFLTNQSVVIFRPTTLEKLLAEEKLSEIFEIFDVKYILGYQPDLSLRIKNATPVKVVADDSILLNQSNFMTGNKSWFLNLIK